jgi:ribonuclease P protein component
MRRKFRLRDSADFRRVRQEGKSWSNRLLVLCVSPNSLDYSRFGFAVSKRIGKAALRNRVKRRVREVVRVRLPEIPEGWDLVFIARAPLKEAQFAVVERAVEQLLRRALLLSAPGDVETIEEASEV